MRKLVVGLSGGVDSSLSAALLKEQGHEVLGVHMQNWSDPRFLKGCSKYPEDRRDAVRVAKRLGIPFEVVDFEKEYRRIVIDYFYGEYQAGRTPNPDILCNREIKFGLLLDWALDRGYDGVATGHYAQARDGRLYRGADPAKDQSYFLAQLSRRQLGHAVFPIGHLTKVEVRAEAAKRELPVADKPDSQGLCFVGEIDLAEFLKDRIPARSGAVVTTDGEVVGKHEGAAYYTIGQRRGIGVSKPVPLYVTKTDVTRNTVTVGYDRDLYRKTVYTEPPHWTSGRLPKPLWHGRTGSFDVAIRYRMKAVPAKVRATQDGLKIVFQEAQRGPTPGQFAVLYRGDELAGSAVIR